MRTNGREYGVSSTEICCRKIEDNGKKAPLSCEIIDPSLLIEMKSASRLNEFRTR